MMPAWLIALGIVYAVGIVVLFVGLMISFFRRHPDGAVEMDEIELMGYTVLSMAVSIIWPLALLGVAVGKYLSKTHRAS